jgi:hypothetical protein
MIFFPSNHTRVLPFFVDKIGNLHASLYKFCHVFRLNVRDVQCTPTYAKTDLHDVRASPEELPVELSHGLWILHRSLWSPGTRLTFKKISLIIRFFQFLQFNTFPSV